ncbi:Peptidyl-prolyl cis-trans isomerase (rotamase)-cyclophilin family [Paenibacillus sp. UNC496MF]|uniref:peptidylprolyl isomerase n=1 Tax=Paenibacillus sp. UNC496MF TaxID=1502753 RepID=UPI0008E65A76|nr:peptidylprolyl isomerase [Paenibacillus sp. UNC496MF]SFI31981.1 Peptidyl-prolyl cis-trans isomerase (rotamase)-cyclophilin family [Paenibacillus sp. UNC496MF]
MTMKNRTALTVVLSAMLLVAAACGNKPDDTATNNQTNPGTQTETTAGGGSNGGNGNGGGNAGAPNAATGQPKQWSEKPKMAIDAAKSYSATFSTNKGDFTIELYAKDAPETVNNFVFLSKEKFYDGVKFHRIIQSFMIQSGDPTGTGAGGPGYTIPDELNKGYKYEEGVIAMANTGQPDSGGSQFFICTGADAANLNSMPNYTIFGKVSSGMDVVKAIAATPVTANPATGEESAPTEDVTIQSISISEK